VRRTLKFAAGIKQESMPHSFYSFAFTLFLIAAGGIKPEFVLRQHETVIVVNGVSNERLNQYWLNAIAARVYEHKFDSLKNLRRPFTAEEADWHRLIVRRAASWPLFLDSLAAPFPVRSIPDTVTVITGVRRHRRCIHLRQ
jgi:hypothetical protein